MSSLFNLGELNLLKEKFKFLKKKDNIYINWEENLKIKALKDLTIYSDKSFSQETGLVLKQDTVFVPRKIEKTKKGTPRLKVNMGYITASKKFVELTTEPVTKKKVMIEGKECQVRYDIENYIISLEGKSVKALSDLKIYKDIDFKLVTDRVISQGDVFKVLKIEVTKGGTPRFKINDGYITTNKKFVELTSEPLTKKKVMIDGVEYQVRYDIENYIVEFDNKSIKALSDLKVYKDLNFKKATGDIISKNTAFKPLGIEVTKGGTPRFKTDKGYVTTNKNYVRKLNEEFIENNGYKDNIELSIILPVYNVQEYLSQCLNSILAEKSIKLEVIAVNDGTTDKSSCILQEFYKADKRVKIVNKINGGLGAARNTGVQYAKGKYIWFVDSDDLVEANSIKKAIKQLNSTGADFIVTSYTYLIDDKKNRPAHWIRELHKKPEANTNLASRPDVMVNVPAWTKIYRKDFWDKYQLFYPEKVLYEDQVPSIKSYTLSNNFDISNITTIHWRQRSGLIKSITQNHLDYKNLSARFEQGKECIKILKKLNLEKTAEKRALDYLANKTFTLKNIAFCDEKYWDVLVNGVQYLYNIVNKDDYIKYVDAQDKVLYRYILNNNLEKARDFILKSGLKVVEHKTFKIDNDFYIKLPHFDQLDSGLSVSDFRLSIKQTELISHLERIKFEKNFIKIEGNAYFALIDFERSDAYEFNLIIKHRESGKEYIQLCKPHTNNVIEKRTQHYFNTYKNSAFEIEIDIKAFENWIESKKLNFGEFDILISLSDLKNNRTERSKFQGRSNRTECAVTNSMILESKKFLVCKWKNSFGLIFDYRPEPVVVYDKPKFNKEYLSILANMGSNNFIPSYVRIGDNEEYRCPVSLDTNKNFEIRISREFLNQNFRNMQLKVFDDNGNSRVIHCSNKKLNIKNKGTVLRTSPTSALEIWNEKDILLIQNWVLLDNKLTVEFSSKISMGVTDITLESSKTHFIGKILPQRNKVEFVIENNLLVESSKISNGIFYGGYQIKFGNKTNGDSKNAFWLDNHNQVNESQSNNEFKVTARVIGNNTSEFLFESINNIRRKGPIWAENMRTYLKQKNITQVNDKLIYLQCLRGDQVNDNQLSICNELLSRGGWDIVWGIEDNSVSFPINTRAVLIGSTEYWNTLRTAKYLCFNHEVPHYLDASKKQKVIQTYHGHPFKCMGMKKWKTSNLNDLQIKESLKIREKWDYLMSPSPVATKMYEENYPVKAEIIEVGHPRNDILATYTDEFREIIRSKLGIPSSKKAVLFAPTWRDYMTADPWSSSVPEFIQPEDLADKLSDEFIVLFRGHPAHGRKGIQKIINEKVIDVTYWPNVNDLLIACDIGIYDYSSIRFDHAVTRKPMVFYVPDKDLYFQYMPSLIAYDETTPGPQISTIEELAMEVTRLSSNFNWRCDEQYLKFIDMFVPMDDGKATERFVDKVFY